MFDEFGSLKGLLKLDSVCIDNNVFRLHYKATVILLITFSLLVTSRQYIGEPIKCIVENVDKFPENVMNTYCWITSTFIIPKWLNGTVGKNIPALGVGPLEDGDEVKYYKYYQWVCFTLFFQAILFYVPRYMWKTWEGGRIKMLVLDLNCPVVSDDIKSDRKKLLVNFFYTHLNTQNFYAFRFFICEVLNFINVVGQIFFMDYFLDGEFSTYGLDVMKFTEMEPDERIDPMARVFPKLTKCTFNKYGASGTIETIDGLCVLPLNIVNEKIFVFLWFWFIVLSILSGISLLYRLAMVISPQVRLSILRTRNRLTPQDQVEAVACKLQFGDWFVLYQLSKNINPMVNKELMADLAEKFQDIWPEFKATETFNGLVTSLQAYQKATKRVSKLAIIRVIKSIESPQMTLVSGLFFFGTYTIVAESQFGVNARNMEMERLIQNKDRKLPGSISESHLKEYTPKERKINIDIM